MTTISDALELAVEHHRAGRLYAAEEIYAQILATDPDHADALHLRGVIALNRGQNDLAVESIRRAIELKQGESVFHCNLGNALNAQGKLDEAVACFRRALVLKPDYIQACNNLGNVLQTQGKQDEAIACFRRVLELKPAFAEAHYNLGIALQAQEKMDEAVDSYRRAVELNPDFYEAHTNLGNALQTLGDSQEALACHCAALELKPALAEAHCNLGSSFQALGKLEEALACFHRALELKPDYAEAYYNLGTALQAKGDLDEAVAAYSRALELKPDYSAACYNRGATLHDQGKLDEAVASYRRVLELKPDDIKARGNLLMALQYCPGTTLADLLTAHAEYERLQAAPLRATWRPHANDRDAKRRLRVGFVSPDLGQHPVGHFVIGAIENLDRDQLEVVCFSDRTNKDHLTTRFEAAAALWRNVRGCSDQELAEKIRAERVDILFDLSGHTAGNRLLTFARKPAPIQVTWAGYVGTTGLAAMDYILADRYELPEGAEAHYRERVLRMPDGYVTYAPSPFAPAVSSLPALKNGRVTFGSFSNPAKISPHIVEVWANILERVPQSLLVLKNRGMNDASVAGRLAKEFAGFGIGPARVEYSGWSPHTALLAEYGRIDLALDTFPYNGGLTTCEALWMGVPVITCPGETFASRHSLSHLSNAGVRETIASDFDEYVELAVSFASDLPRLAALRAGLRERMAGSPLCDGKRFAENLMRALQDIWRVWCGQAEAQG